MKEDRGDKRQIVGWIAVGLSTAITCFWAFWGIIETFHEGWYYESLLANVGLMVVQYLSPMLVFLGVALVSILWPRIGGALHAIFALFAAWFFGALANPAMVILIAPLVGLGALHWFGRPQPRKLAVALAVGLPVLTMILSGVGPASEPRRVREQASQVDFAAEVSRRTDLKASSCAACWSERR
jgi:hypothetical protein